MDRSDGKPLSVAVHLTDTGYRVRKEVQLTSDMSFATFQERVEQLFDQRLHLSFVKSRPVRDFIGSREIGGEASSSVKQGIGSILDRCIMSAMRPRREVLHMPLTAQTWHGFLSLPPGRRICKAWSVFPGHSLAAAESRSLLSRKQVIEKFESGLQQAPREKKLAGLRRKLDEMQEKDRKSRQEPHSPDLFRRMHPDERDGTVKRLWAYAVQRNSKKAELLKEEEHMMRRLEVSSRHPKEVTEEEEERVRSLVEQPLQRHAELLEQLQTKYEPTYRKPNDIVLSQQELSDTVQRLFTTAEDRLLKREATKIKVYGAPPVTKKLTKSELEARIGSLYTGAVTKKKEKLAKLTVEHKSPVPVSCGALSPSRVRDLAERLSRPKLGS